jgi:hypothetical protein
MNEICNPLKYLVSRAGIPSVFSYPQGKLTSTPTIPLHAKSTQNLQVLNFSGEPRGDRTHDLRIKSQNP